MERVKPDLVRIRESRVHKGYLECRVSRPGESCTRNFKTKPEALAWVKNFVFSVPSWEEVTENGRWSCE